MVAEILCPPHLQPCGEQGVYYEATEGGGEVHIRLETNCVRVRKVVLKN